MNLVWRRKLSLVLVTASLCMLAQLQHNGVDAARWGSISQGECWSPGYRKRYSRLMNIAGDWGEACRNTAGWINSVNVLPDNCVDKGFWGMWGEWKVQDSSCDPHWGPFKDDGCQSNGCRQFSSILWNIPDGLSWENWCSESWADINGQHFDRPTRCVNTVLNMWGEFDFHDEFGCNRYCEPTSSMTAQSFSVPSYSPTRLPPSYAPAGSPPSYSPSGSRAPSYSPSGSPPSYSPSGSPAPSNSSVPAGSPPSYSPSGSSAPSNSSAPAGSPPSYSPSRSPAPSSAPSGSPPSYSPSRSPAPFSSPSGSPWPSSAPAGSPTLYAPSGSPPFYSPSGSPPLYSPSRSPPSYSPSGSPSGSPAPSLSPSGSPAPSSAPAGSPALYAPSGSPPSYTSSPSSQRPAYFVQA